MESTKKFDEYFNQINEAEEHTGLKKKAMIGVMKALEHWKVAYSGVYQQVQWGFTEFNLVDLARQASISPLLLCEFILSDPKQYGCNICLSGGSPSVKKLTPLEYCDKYGDIIKVVFYNPAEIC